MIEGERENEGGRERGEAGGKERRKDEYCPALLLLWLPNYPSGIHKVHLILIFKCKRKRKK